MMDHLAPFARRRVGEVSADEDDVDLVGCWGDVTIVTSVEFMTVLNPKYTTTSTNNTSWAFPPNARIRSFSLHTVRVLSVIN